MRPQCTIPDCIKPQSGRGWCGKHYYRWQRYGNPNYQPVQTLPSTERFWHYVHKTDTCWLWIGTRAPDGYGHFKVNGRPMQAHRFAYEMLVGPIPQGLTVDHLCRNPPCVNPDHLEIVSMRENMYRGISGPAINARKTHCVRGHPFDEANTLWRTSRGQQWRNCRICLRMLQTTSQRRRRAQKRQS